MTHTVYLAEIINSEVKNQDDESIKYPNTVPLIQHLSRFEFTNRITIICGDNGSGKSTLIKGIAEQLGAYKIDGLSYQTEVRLYDFLQLKTRRKPKRAFHFTGEDFIRYIEWLEKTKQESRDAIDEINENYGADSYSAMLARQPHERTIGDIKHMYEGSLSQQSHGEGFLNFFKSRLIKDGLYLIDEPESALSYENQYVISMLIREAASEGAQFIIATHSPIITGIPEADLFEIKDGKLIKTDYDSLENIQFLNLFIRKRKYLFE